MKRLVIFGMFIGMMIARPTNAFFERKKIQGDEEKEVTLSKGNTKNLLNSIQKKLQENALFREDQGSKEHAAVLVVRNALAGRLSYWLLIDLSKELLLVIPKAVSYTAFDYEIEDLIENIRTSGLNKAREILNNWLGNNKIKVRTGSLDSEKNLSYILTCQSLDKERGEITAVFYSKETRKVLTGPRGSIGGLIMAPYTEDGKLEPFKLTIKGKGKIERSWEKEEIYNWEETIEGPKVEFLKDIPELMHEEKRQALEETRLPVLSLPTWKEIPVEDGLATALVIDKSGSMTGEKISRAKQAAYVYVDTSAERQDMFSLAAFSSDAESITEPVSITEGRDILKKDILSLSAGGSTNVGSGLTIALSHLSSCNLKEKRALLMSDGMHNTGTYKPEVVEFQKMGWPISTVAFGKDADQEMLSWIANQTGGSFFPAESSDIASVYHKINVISHNGSVYRSYNDFIKTGEKLAYDIPVEPDMKKVGFFTNWQGSTMETILLSPNKTVINRSNISNYGRFLEGGTHNLFEINNPQCGPWQVLITGSDLPSQGEQINFHSFCQSDVFSNILGFQPGYSQNQEVRIGVKLAEVINGRLSPLRGAQVITEIKKPSLSLNKVIKQQRLEPLALMEIFREISGSAQKITLFDDGSHNDFGSGDGIYANTYNDTTLNGPYLVTIDCQGSTSQGMLAKRTLQESFQVGPIEQNSFTISDFLGLLTQQSANRQIPFPIQGTEGTKGAQTEEFMKSLLDQLLKK